MRVASVSRGAKPVRSTCFVPGERENLRRGSGWEDQGLGVGDGGIGGGGGGGGGGGLGGLGLRIGILLLRGGDGMVRVWRRESGEVCGELRGGGGDVWRFSNRRRWWGGGRSGGWSCGI